MWHSGAKEAVMETLGQVYISVVVAPSVLLIVGLLWSPFAMAIGALVAWRRNQPWDEGLGAGFFSSAMLFLPWLYLMGRTIGIRLPHGLGHVAAGVVLGSVYALWAFNYVGTPLVWLVWSWGFDDTPSVTIVEEVILTGGLLLMAAGSGLAWVYTGRTIYQQWRAGGVNSHATRNTLGDPWYMVPWGFMACLSIALVVIVFLGMAFGFSGT